MLELVKQIKHVDSRKLRFMVSLNQKLDLIYGWPAVMSVKRWKTTLSSTVEGRGAARIFTFDITVFALFQW